MPQCLWTKWRGTLGRTRRTDAGWCMTRIGTLGRGPGWHGAVSLIEFTILLTGRADVDSLPDMNFGRLTVPQRVSGVAMLVVALAAFLPWVSIFGISAIGIEGDGVLT